MEEILEVVKHIDLILSLFVWTTFIGIGLGFVSSFLSAFIPRLKERRAIRKKMKELNGKGK
jgi:NhaP-type Na+/H+ or K+/H+ antiporter